MLSRRTAKSAGACWEYKRLVSVMGITSRSVWWSLQPERHTWRDYGRLRSLAMYGVRARDDEYLFEQDLLPTMSSRPPDRDHDHGSLQFDDGPPAAMHQPLPAWGGPRDSRRVPPHVYSRRNRHVAPQLETILKGTGVLLILIAMIAAGLVAMPSRNPAASSTATADPALVIAASGTGPAAADGTPESLTGGDGIAVESRYQDIVICLDPGHGGQDRGHQRLASASAPAMDESYFNLAIANALRNRLEQRGFVVAMTRTEDIEANASGLDTNLDGKTRADGANAEESGALGVLDETQARIDRCNDARADILLSIHFDGSSDTSQQGSSIWYSAGRPFGPLNQQLACCSRKTGINLPLAGYSGETQGVFEESQLPAKGDDLFRQIFLVLGPEHEDLKEPSAMPGAIAEILTITNDNDAIFLFSDDGIEAIVDAFDRAIVRFMEMHPPE